MSSFLHRFAAEFASLDADKLGRLGELYSDDVHFTDPLHEVVGLAELQRYFAELYANVEQLHFEFISHDRVRGTGLPALADELFATRASIAAS